MRTVALLLLLCAALASAATYTGLQNENLERTIDIRTHIEETIVRLRVTNVGKEKASTYLVGFPADVASHLSFVEGVFGDNEKGPKAFATHVVVSDLDAPAGTKFFSMPFPSPLKPGDSIRLKLLQVFTRRLVAYPAQVLQDEKQLLKYAGSAVFFSPYKTGKDTTRVKLGTSRIESYTKVTATVNNEGLDAGPFTDVKPFSVEPLNVHFENNSPFITMLNAVKEIEISHRGNIAVEDSYNMKHTGAELKGSFSRFEYQRMPNPAEGSSFRSLVAYLPNSADGIYYTDQIGNISTSRVRRNRRGEDVHFEIEPRFPMFGGWEADFKIGYNVPASQFLLVDKADPTRFVLNITFGSPFQNAAIDKLEVRIILPEHATDIQWATPFDIDAESSDVRVTYLDVVGRPVLILHKNNACKYHNVHFQVGYKFPAMLILQEPLMLVGIFLAFFAISGFYLRTDLRITSSSPGRSTLRSRRSGRPGEVINRLLDKQVPLIAHYDAVRARPASDAAANAEGDRLYAETMQLVDQLQQFGESTLTLIAQRLDVAEQQARGAAKRYQRAADEAAVAETRAKYATRIDELGAVLLELALW